jgi:hypothetical protein
MQLIKNLLWIDCFAGATAGVIVVLASAWLSDLYSVPQKLLLLMGIVNLLYACYSFSLAISSKRPGFFIKMLIVANAIWAFVCLGIAARFSASMTLPGYIHLVGEAVFVGGLAFAEWNWRDQLVTQN